MKDVLKWLVIGGVALVPCLALLVTNDLFFPFITGKNFYFRIIVEVVAVLYVALALYEPRYRPQWSWVLGGAGAVLVVMFFANLFGEHPQSSFWSNFERMDGYVSLVHTYLYMLIIGSVLQTKQEWNRFFIWSLAISALVALGGLGQYFSIASITTLYDISATTGRLDSTLGNAAYMAVYMLFHIFIIFWLLAAPVSMRVKYSAAALLPIYFFVLVETGTRGTAVGLVAGVVVVTAYIAAFERQLPRLRQVAVTGLIAVCVAVGGFIAFKDSQVVQSQPNLARIANISLEDLEIRRIIWGMAWQGVQERPLLGWGQSNFNYVFNEHYDPRLYAQEQWFDRAHNIFFDWLIAGGWLGLLAYLSIFAACVYYLVVQPLRRKDARFSVIERAILLGLLVGYFTHNLVVFDNIVSYIFFAVILGLIHARVARPIQAWGTKPVDAAIVSQAVLPVGMAALVVLYIFVHRPGLAAAGDIIDAYRSLQPSVVAGVQQPPAGPLAMLDRFHTAIERDSFGKQEVAEQLAQQTMNLARTPQVPAEVNTAFASSTDTQLTQLLAYKPGDARIHVFVASYYQSIGDAERAATEMARARELSPNKQGIINQQGFIALTQGDYAGAADFFQTSFELDEQNPEARELYAAALLYNGQLDQAAALMNTAAAKARFANSNFLLTAAQQAGATQLLEELYRERISQQPAEAQHWASLAFVQYEAGDAEAAAATLREGGQQISSFASTATCIADNIAAGVPEPQTGC